MTHGDIGETFRKISEEMVAGESAAAVLHVKRKSWNLCRLIRGCSDFRDFIFERSSMVQFLYDFHGLMCSNVYVCSRVYYSWSIYLWNANFLKNLLDIFIFPYSVRIGPIIRN